MIFQFVLVVSVRELVFMMSQDEIKILSEIQEVVDDFNRNYDRAIRLTE